MLKIKLNEISLSKGDSASLNINLNTALSIGDKVQFTVKEKTFPDYTNEVLQKNITTFSNGGQTATIEFEPEDTRNLNSKAYYYDIRIIFSNGDVYTPDVPHKFTVLGVVGNGI